MNEKIFQREFSWFQTYSLLGIKNKIAETTNDITMHLVWSFFLTAISLFHGQLWVILEGAASLTQY